MSTNPRDNISLPGKLVVFEGIDRSGKTTQLTLLSKALTSKGIPHRIIKFPCLDTKCGTILSEHLTTRDAVRSRRAIHLLFSANRWEMMKEIVTTLESGTHILMDRYAFSGVAYSVGAEGLSYDWCIRADEDIVSPDVVIYMDNSPSASARRNNFGDERYEDESKLDRVRKVYQHFYTLPYWHVFDATRTREALADDIYKVVDGLMKSEPRRLSDTDLRLPKDFSGFSSGCTHLLPPFI